MASAARKEITLNTPSPNSASLSNLSESSIDLPSSTLPLLLHLLPPSHSFPERSSFTHSAARSPSPSLQTLPQTHTSPHSNLNQPLQSRPNPASPAVQTQFASFELPIMSIHHAHKAHTHHHRRSLHSPREAPTARMPTLQIRDSNGSQTTYLTPTMINLLIALLVLVIVGIVAIIALFVLRSRRRSLVDAQSEKTSISNDSTLPAYSPPVRHSHKPSHRRLTVTAAPYGRNSASIFSVHTEKEALMYNNSPPMSPIPEIRITFPEEEDEMGKRKSGRVVVVKVSELGGVGMEPLENRQYREGGLPAYGEGEGWKELDLEGMGGLKEKPRQWKD